jgi:hypothetical protein
MSDVNLITVPAQGLADGTLFIIGCLVFVGILYVWDKVGRK